MQHKKSKRIVFLFLASSLVVMLLPFGGTNSMSNTINALAFEEEYDYDTGQYEEYAMNMADKYANDNDKNNNYKSHQNNDFIKKIDCNSINYNFNGLEIGGSGGDLIDPNGVGAATATAIQGDEDEQEDGAAEGVSSSTNAFGNSEKRNNNNHNFEVDCINNNDNEGGQGAGIPGPQGPQGPQGEQGPAGTTQLNPSNTYLATSDLDPETATASCDSGDFSISGGYATNGGEVREFLRFTDETWSTKIVGSPGNLVLTAVFVWTIHH